MNGATNRRICQWTDRNLDTVAFQSAAPSLYGSFPIKNSGIIVKEHNKKPRSAQDRSSNVQRMGSCTHPTFFIKVTG